MSDIPTGDRVVVGVDGSAASAAERLLEESEDARMLVVGRRGTGRVLCTVLGSVSSALVSHARCPVLVVHA
jgi:nucleotide-binding universal stress UspA family protein